MAGKKPQQIVKTTPAQARKQLGTMRLAVDKKHLNVLPGHRVIVEMGGKTYDGHVTKTVGDGRVQFQIATPICKSARTLDSVLDERRRIIRDFREFHGLLETGNASVHLVPEIPAGKKRKREKGG